MAASGGFKRRSAQAEWMDTADFDPRVAAQSFRFIQVVNRFFGGTWLVKRFIAQAAQRHPPGRTLKILDIGSGSCDIPVALCQWAAPQDIDLAFVCVEASALAVELAQKRLAGLPHLPVRLVHADIFAYQPAERFDYAIGSMVFHHLEASQIQSLICRLAPLVGHGIFINDLRRCLGGYLGCLALAMSASAPVRHDALLSVKKGFCQAELAKILQGAGDYPVASGNGPFFRVWGYLGVERDAWLPDMGGGFWGGP